MNQKVSDLRTRIFYSLEDIPTYPHNWGEVLYESYKSIVEDAALINEDDAKDIDLFRIFGKDIFYYSNDTNFLDELKKSKIITLHNRATVVGNLKSLDLAIKNATE